MAGKRALNGLAAPSLHRASELNPNGIVREHTGCFTPSPRCRGESKPGYAMSLDDPNLSAAKAAELKTF
jgi:hypothetical protein